MVAVGNVVAGEFIIDTGLDFGISRIKSREISGSTYDKPNSINFALKLNYVFDTEVFIGINFSIGRATIKDFWKVNYTFEDGSLAYSEIENANGVHCTFDLVFGYAIDLGTEKVKLLIGPVVGVNHTKYEEYALNNYEHTGYDLLITMSTTFFEIGGEALLQARFGNSFGMYAGCKVVALTGQAKVEGNLANYTSKAKEKYKGFEIKPTVGVQFTF